MVCTCQCGLAAPGTSSSSTFYQLFINFAAVESLIITQGDNLIFFFRSFWRFTDDVGATFALILRNTLSAHLFLSLSSLWFAPLPLSLPLALSLSPSLSLLYLYLLTPPPPPPPPLLLSSASKSAIHGAKASFSPFSSRMAFFKYLRSVKNELILFSAPLLLLPLPLVIGTSVCKWCGRDNRFNLTLSQCWKSRGVKKKRHFLAI